MNYIVQQIIVFILISIPVLIEILTDYDRIVKRQKIDNHVPDSFIRAIMIIGVAVINLVLFKVNTWQTIILSISWFWLWFDYILNIAIGRPIWYLGTTSWFDKKLREINPLAILFAKVWFFGVAIGIYYFWNKVCCNWNLTF